MRSEQLRSWDGHDSEFLHTSARDALHLAQRVPFGLDIVERFADQGERYENERLHMVVGGIEFENPVMVGAGWDKAGKAVAALHRLGFSGTEVGTVTALSQPGNEKPRQWMISPGVSLNRLGFNSPGADAVAKNLDRYTAQNVGVVGISIGKNKDIPSEHAPAAHFIATQKLYEFADYFAINVSSPNTPGLRSLQEKGPLTDIVQAVNSAMDSKGERKPLFVKIAPDNLTNEAVNDVIRVAIDNGLSGIIATNTTVNPEIKAAYGTRWQDQMGGVAGDNSTYRRMSTEMVRHIYKETGGTLDVIGVGGVKDYQTALEKIKAGAKVIQVVTAIRGEQPLHRAIFEQGRLPGRINRDIVNWMDHEGVNNLSEVIGQES